MKSENSLSRKVWRYIFRALRLRCPVCGISPMFLPLHRVEGLVDWFDTLDGCPRCDYVYHREPGYFLFALWMINFSLVAVFGVLELVFLDGLFDLSTAQLMFITLVTLWVLGVLSVRHTKALFLAMDHLIHPHAPDE